MRRIVRESGVGPDDVVVEVGPGLGSLTLALLEVADRVVAIEVDDLLAARLPATIAEHAGDRAGRCEVVHADALRVDGVPGPPPTALVANLPYNVSVPVLLHLLDRAALARRRGLVMVQAEVADRLAAPPGSRTYGVPSVKAAWFADVRRAGAVVRSVFWPAPNVDSGLVAWTRRDPPVTTASREQVFAVVDAAFAQRRKTLRGALRSSPAPPTPPRPRCARPAWTRPRAARCSTSRPSRASPRPWPGRCRHEHHRPRPGQDQPPPRRRRGPRPDGFHPLVTVYQAVGLCDDVTASSARPGWTLGVTVPDWIDPDAVPVTGDNIVDRAARLLAAHHGVPARAAVSVIKSIPVAGRHGRRLGRRRGRAGGPGPALGAARPPTTTCWPWPPSSGATCRSRWSAAPRSAPAAASSSSRSADPATWWWVVIPSGEGLSTPAVYRRFDELNPRRRGASRRRPTRCCARWRPATRDVLALALHNDLEDAALDLRPDLADLLEVGERRGALRGLVSGSGPTCVFLTDGADEARAGGRAALGDAAGRPGRQRPGGRRPRGAAMPNLVNLERVSKSYGVRPLLTEVSLGVGAGERIGVVGRNGDGKTTLLNVMTGLEEPDAGRVSRQRGLLIGYLRQHDELDDTHTVREAVLAGRSDHEWAADSRTREVVEVLLAGVTLDRAVVGLSGGERRRCSLAALLLGEHDLIVLDEPTNHLDVEAVAWLADHLARRTSALVVVTHDRWFLDAVCQWTWEVHDGVVDVYEGGYAALRPRAGRAAAAGGGHRAASPATWSARSWPGCAGGRRRGRRSRSSASTRPTR